MLQLILFFGEVLDLKLFTLNDLKIAHTSAKLKHGVILVRVQTGNQSKAQKSVQNIIYKLYNINKLYRPLIPN